MFNLRLRQAETALSEGRLEEAVELATQREVRGHHDGQKLVTRLIAGLVARGSQHLEAGRIEDARRDCRLASGLGGNQTEVAQLAVSIGRVTDSSRRQTQRDQELIDAVAGEVNRGECETGERILDRVSDDHSVAAQLGDQIAVKREQIEAAAERARQRVGSSRNSESMAAIQELQRLSPQHPELPELIDRITGPAVSEIRTAAIDGRLDRAARTLESVRPLVEFDPDLSELDQVLDLSQRVRGEIESSSFTEAASGLRTLQTLLGEAGWIKELADRTEQAATLLHELKSTPLSLLNGVRQAETVSLPGRNSSSPGRSSHNGGTPSRQPPANIHPVSHEQHSSGGPANSYLLQIDGVGSALLLPGTRTRIGTAASSRTSSVDLALSGYPQGEKSVLERIGADYRLRAGCDAQVNGRTVTEKLLSSDERIELGRRCRLRFRKPHPASSSAVLELDGTRLARADVRTVVLFDDTLIAGPTRSCHLTGASLEQPLVVFQRGGEFYVRNGIAGRGPRGSVDAMPLTMGTAVEIGGTRVMLSRVES